MALPTRPTKDAEFASSGAAIVEPIPTKKQLGWIAEKMPHQWLNWLHNTYWLWQIYFDRRITYTEAISASMTPATTRSRKYHVDATAGGVSFTLPAITSAENDLAYELKKIDASANVVTIVGTVEGQVNPTIDNQYTGVALYAFGGNWFWSK